MPPPTMTFDAVGTILLSIGVLVILSNVVMLVITKRSSVGRFLLSLRTIYTVNICWHIASNIRYFVPFDSTYALQVAMTVHFCIGALFLLTIVIFNIKVLEAFKILTALSPKFTTFLKVLAVCLNVLMITINLAVRWGPIKALAPVSSIVMITCAGYIVIVNNGKTVHILRLVYKDRLRVSKKNQQMKEDISRKYLRLNVTFVIIFVLEVVGMVIWGIGLIMSIEKMIKTSELISSFSLMFYPTLIVGVRDLRFDKRSVLTANKSNHQPKVHEIPMETVAPMPGTPLRSSVVNDS